jgi:hypothetical protein
MKHTLIILPFLLLSLNADEIKVTKKDWINRMSTALPTVFCQEKQYFRQCFKITAEQCEETAASVTRICLNKSKNKIPEILIQPKDGAKWGTVVGQCAGETFELALMENRINNNKCNNIENWK